MVFVFQPTSRPEKESDKACPTVSFCESEDGGHPVRVFMMTKKLLK
jgi:hypothetical protein